MALLIIVIASSVIAITDPNPISINWIMLTYLDLPRGYTIHKKMRVHSDHVLTFYNDPTMGGKLPAPVEVSYQTLYFDDKPRGTILFFQYEDKEEAAKIRYYLRTYLWGTRGGPNSDIPEEMFLKGRFIMIFSFKYKNEESLWLRHHYSLYSKVDFTSRREKFRFVMQRAVEYSQSSGAKECIEFLERNYVHIKDFSLGECMLAKMYFTRKDYENAEYHYEEALDLHKTTDRIKDAEILWEAYDRLGIIYTKTGRADRAIVPYYEAYAIAQSIKERKYLAATAYNLACALAIMKQYKGVYFYLGEAIKIDASYKERAIEEYDLREVLKQKKFIELFE